MELSGVRVRSLRGRCRRGEESGRVQEWHEVCVQVGEENRKRAMKGANDCLAEVRILPCGVELSIEIYPFEWKFTSRQKRNHSRRNQRSKRMSSPRRNGTTTVDLFISRSGPGRLSERLRHRLAQLELQCLEVVAILHDGSGGLRLSRSGGGPPAERGEGKLVHGARGPVDGQSGIRAR